MLHHLRKRNVAWVESSKKWTMEAVAESTGNYSDDDLSVSGLVRTHRTEVMIEASTGEFWSKCKPLNIKDFLPPAFIDNRHSYLTMDSSAGDGRSTRAPDEAPKALIDHAKGWSGFLLREPRVPKIMFGPGITTLKRPEPSIHPPCHRNYAVASTCRSSAIFSHTGGLYTALRNHHE